MPIGPFEWKTPVETVEQFNDIQRFCLEHLPPVVEGSFRLYQHIGLYLTEMTLKSGHNYFGPTGMLRISGNTNGAEQVSEWLELNQKGVLAYATQEYWNPLTPNKKKHPIPIAQLLLDPLRFNTYEFENSTSLNPHLDWIDYLDKDPGFNESLAICLSGLGSNLMRGDLIRAQYCGDASGQFPCYEVNHSNDSFVATNRISPAFVL